MEINPPFPSPFKFEALKLDSPALLVYSGATSLGLFTIGLARLIRTLSGSPYRIFATASPKNREKLLALGVEAVYDYPLRGLTTFGKQRRVELLTLLIVSLRIQARYASRKHSSTLVAK